jgi:4'-phosphopantetheinyl transferase
MVGVAVTTTDRALGFDLEPLTRKTVNPTIADHFFCSQELDWLQSLAKSAQQVGFLQLWTLKEALLKAIGRGLSEDLTSFWFGIDPPAIHFSSAWAEREADWWFAQRILGGRFMAAVALRGLSTERIMARWEVMHPEDLVKD